MKQSQERALLGMLVDWLIMHVAAGWAGDDRPDEADPGAGPAGEGEAAGPQGAGQDEGREGED